MKQSFIKHGRRRTRLLRMVMVAVLLTLNFSFFAVIAQHTLTINDVTFDASSGTITSYNASYTDIIIPSSFNVEGSDIDVTAIGNRTFQDKGLTDVSIPGTIATIGDWAFANNLLTSVSLPNELQYLKKGAFYYNNLTNIVIPAGISYLSNFVFEGNPLTSVVIPDNISMIGYKAFYNNSLTSVTFDEKSNIRLISKDAFSNNDDLPAIVLPMNANNGFSGYKDNDGNNFNESDIITDFSKSYYAVLPIHTVTEDEVDLADGTINNYYGGYVNIIIPEYLDIDGTGINITKIGFEAFKNRSLINIVLPDGLTGIEPDAFYGNDLTSIKIPDNVTSIDFRAFSTNQLTEVVLPEKLTTIQGKAFSNNQLTSVTVPENVTKIEQKAFAYNKINTLTLPGNLTYIGDMAFYYNDLTTLNLPGKLMYIGINAFAENSITNILIPPGVTTIGSKAFTNNKLTSVIFEKNSLIRLIGNKAFSGNTDLESFELPVNINTDFSGYRDDDGNSYNEGGKITDFETGYYAVLPAHYITLDETIFIGTAIVKYFGGYTNIVIPVSFDVNGTDIDVNSIEMYAFYRSSLTNIKMPNRITTIRIHAFENNNLTHVDLPDSVSLIEYSAFAGNPLSSISLPDPVKKEGYSFINWKNTSGTVVTEITDFNTSYEAQFNLTGYLVSGEITIDDPENLYLKITGDISGTRVVNYDYTYSFALNAGRSIVITPVKDGYTFTPSSISINNISSNMDGLDFIASMATSISKPEERAMAVYPIPVDNILTIETGDNYNELKIFNIGGTEVRAVNCKGMNHINIDLSNLTRGIYILELTGKDGSVVKKIIKK